LAIVLDGKVQSAPEIHMRIADSGIIEGRPFGIPVDAGACAWRGLYSRYRSAVTLGAVSVFMAAYYQMAGVNAIIAMILNIVILLAAIAYFAITLTLPGIAGVTLTIGVRYRLQYPHL
jgi:preprotein translocase subunit SecD